MPLAPVILARAKDAEAIQGKQISVFKGLGHPSRVVRNAVALMLSTGATALLGVAFWGVAAHLYRPSAIGQASAELSAMTLLAQIAQLNLANAFLRFLPRAGTRTRSLILLGYAACSGLAVGVVVLFLATPLSSGVIPRGITFALLFAGAVLLWTIFVVQDGVLTGLRAAVWVPVENISFGALKLLLLPVTLGLAGLGVFLAWTLPVLLAVGGVNALLFLRIIPTRMASSRQGPPTQSFELPGRRALLSFVGTEYVASVVSASTTFLLPLIIITRLGSTANAHFFIPWIVGVAFANLLLNISASFIVETLHDDEPFRILFWHSLRMMIAIAVVATLVTVLAGPRVLALLAQGYATAGSGLVRWIGLSFPFSVVTAMFTASLWIRRRLWLLIGYQSVQVAILIGLTYLLIGRLGINAAGVAYFIANGGVALVSIPPLVRWYRRSSSEPENHGPSWSDRSVISA